MPDALSVDAAIPGRAHEGMQSARKDQREGAGSLPGTVDNSNHSSDAIAAGEDELCPGTDAQILNQGAFPYIMRPKKVILCVDDNEQELSVLKFMLATNGYRVVSALTGQEAIGMFSDHAVDLVLSDYSMPQMNGDQLVNRLKQM